MTVKFIVTFDGQIIFGDRHFKDDLHVKVAKRNGIPKDRVVCGGIADLETRKIWGKSYDFGPYDRDYISALLPDWIVAVSGNY